MAVLKKSCQYRTDFHKLINMVLIFIIISLSICAVIGQFAGHILVYGPLKLFLLPKCFVIYRQLFLTSLASKSLKLRFAFEVRQIFEAIPLALNPTGSLFAGYRQTHSRDIINFLLTSFSRSVLLVTDPRFPPPIYAPHCSCIGISGHKSMGKQLGP